MFSRHVEQSKRREKIVKKRVGVRLENSKVQTPKNE
jgi:hypothetical protein